MSRGVIIDPDEGIFDGYKDEAMIHAMVDQSKEPVILPPIPPAEHFSVIIYPVASGISYDAYLLESREAFHSNRVIGVTGIARYDQPQGIDYCIRIVDDLKRNENEVEVVSSGWIYGEEQYALDIVLTHVAWEITLLELPFAM